MINANKRHSCVGTQGILAARLFIDFHILAEHMGTLQMMFWCNTVVDRNDAYEEEADSKYVLLMSIIMRFKMWIGSRQ